MNHINDTACDVQLHRFIRMIPANRSVSRDTVSPSSPAIGDLKKVAGMSVRNKHLFRPFGGYTRFEDHAARYPFSGFTFYPQDGGTILGLGVQG